MSMQVIEKRVWCFTVSPGPLSILEEDDELDGDFEEDEKADPEDVLGPDDEDAAEDEGEDLESESADDEDDGGEDPEEEPEDDDEDDEDFEDLSSVSDEEDFEVRLVVDFHSTIDRVLEMFNASRAVLGVGPNDTVTGLIAESTAVQLHASMAH